MKKFIPHFEPEEDLLHFHLICSGTGNVPSLNQFFRSNFSKKHSKEVEREDRYISDRVNQSIHSAGRTCLSRCRRVSSMFSGFCFIVNGFGRRCGVVVEDLTDVTS